MQYEAAMLVHDFEQSYTLQTELYDSGALQHMSPYCDCFINFVSIVLKVITTANQLAFDVSGCGEMEIKVPLDNGKLLMVLLKDVLYAQDMDVALASISHITATGYKAVFDRPLLKIYNSLKKLLGEVPVS